MPEIRYFTLLPAELRLHIYEISLPTPRIAINFRLRCSEEEWKMDQESFLLMHKPYELVTTGSIPSLLHVSSETRHFARQHYTLFTLPRPSDPHTKIGLETRQIYFDFRRDVVCIPDMGYSNFQAMFPGFLIWQFDLVENVLLEPDSWMVQPNRAMLRLNRSANNIVVNLVDFAGVKRISIFHVLEEDRREIWELRGWKLVFNGELVGEEGNKVNWIDVNFLGIEEAESWSEESKGLV